MLRGTPFIATMDPSQTRGPQKGAASMKRTTKYVALDVHQATTGAPVQEASARVIPERAPNRRSRARVLPGDARAIHVAFEEGAKGQWLHDLLTRLGVQVVVCDPRAT